MKTYRYANQYKKVKKSYLLECVIAFSLTFYVGMIITQAKPLNEDMATKVIKQFTFGKFAPLAVAVEPKLMEEKVAGESAVPKGIKTEIYQYLIEKFGDHASDAIAIIRTCENGTFDPQRESGINIHPDGHKSIDIGVMQINVDVRNTAEIEALKDYKYNIDRGFAKWQAGDGKTHKNSFYLWTCAKVINQYNYVDAMKGK